MSSRLLAPSALALLVASGIVACGGGEPRPTAPVVVSQPEPRSSAPQKVITRQLPADTPMKTASGATFEAPKGWFLTERGDLLVLEDPERDLTLTLVEIPNEPDAPKAIAAAWKRVKPDFARKPKQTASPPATDGWDAITQINYETGGTENRTVIGVAQRKATTQYVLLIDGADAGLSRRGAQLQTVVSTFKAVGVDEESFAGRIVNVFDEVRQKRLEQFIGDAMARAHVPGAAIAVVQDGRVVYEKGFGVREEGKKEPVTPSTLFMIGSTTKSLTTLLMAKLVDEGKLRWDEPVTEVLPTFALADGDVTKKVLVKHTVCACTGLPRQDMEFLFEYAGVTPEQRIDSMKTMKPTTGFGETFQYSNTMVALGGYLAGHALEPTKKLGLAYDDAMQSRVFGPLGMTGTTMDFSVVKRREHAAPHAKDVSETTLALPLANEEALVSVRPAGGAWSSARDMAKVIQLELSKGRDPKGKVVISEANLIERRKPQIKVTDKVSYGLGLFLENDHGVRVVHHGGNTLGFTSDMYVLPEHGVGVVLLTNAGMANAFRSVARRRLLEILFDGKEEAEKTLSFALERQHVAAAKELARITRDPDVEWLKNLAGTYKNAGLGTVAIRTEGKKGILDAGEWKSAIGQKKEEDGTLKVVLLDPPYAGLDLVPSEKDGKKKLTLEASQQSYGFELEPPASPKVK